MLIGLDQVLLSGSASGIPNFARGLLSAIADVETDWKCSAFSMKGWSEPDFISSHIDASTSSSSGAPRPRQWRSQLTALALSLPSAARGRIALRALRLELARMPELDLFYALNFVPAGNVRAPVLPVVHDLIHLSHPDLVHPTRRHHRSRLPKIAEQALRVQAVSRSTANELERFLGIARTKIDVVCPVLNPRFLSQPDLTCLQPLGLTQGYFLAVGMSERRKNLSLLVDVAASDPRLVTVEHPLVLTGPPPWEKLPNQGLYDQLHRQGRIRHLRIVSDSTLHALYAGSTGVVMPSISEGFGIPVIEAQASGARLVLSDIEVLREASGSFAAFVSAEDVDGWARAMAELKDSTVDAQTQAAARLHAAGFSSQHAASSAIASLRHYCS